MTLQHRTRQAHRMGGGPATTDVPDPDGAAGRDVDGAHAAAVDYLLSLQSVDGHWCAELEGDTILESEYILTMHFLGRTGEAKVRKAAEHIRRRQLAEGGWAQYPGGDAEVSASVKAYFVLKLLGDDAEAEHMRRARRHILEMGGIEACNSFTKIYLAIFGQYDWGRCAAVPPEMILLPRWFYFNIYEMSSWSRAIIVPLSIIWANKPRCAVPEQASIAELRDAVPPEAAVNAPTTWKGRVWYAFFGLLDRALKMIERSPLKPLRQRALRRSEAWILDRLVKSDGLAAIFPPIINTIVAFRCLGYPIGHPALRAQIRELEKLEIEEDETLRVQPCFSAVWDTGLALNALLASGTPGDDPRLLASGEWLLDREVREVGDRRAHTADAPVGGWYFEYANEFYPDCDDTAAVLAALNRLRFPDAGRERRREEALQRGLRWLLSMQNEDGGWPAFDRGCDKEPLTYVPFADHNAMIDPSCEDITGRVLEVIAGFGYDTGHPVVRRAVHFLEKKQEPDGTWYGRWGCNYIYGTQLAVRGLGAVGAELGAERYRRIVPWLHAIQNPDGGWGESPRCYHDPSQKGRGPSTAAQTAWALTTLFALEDVDSDAVRRGVEYLRTTQRADGSWQDEFWSGTGFPRVFYLRYHLYSTYFPVQALASYRALRRAGATSGRLSAAVAGGGRSS